MSIINICRPQLNNFGVKEEINRIFRNWQQLEACKMWLNPYSEENYWLYIILILSSLDWKLNDNLMNKLQKATMYGKIKSEKESIRLKAYICELENISYHWQIKLKSGFQNRAIKLKTTTTTKLDQEKW